MTLTEIFKTSFETVKAHKKQTLILCVLIAVIRIITDLFSGFHILIVSTISSFLIAIVLFPFIYVLKESEIDRKHLFISALSFTLISAIILCFNLFLSSLNTIIIKAMTENPSAFQLYWFASILIRIIILIIMTISDYVVILAVSESVTPLKSVKLLFDKLKSGFSGKIFKIIVIYFVANLPISIPATVIEFIIHKNVTDTIPFIMISVPFHIYIIVCMYTYWNSLEHNLTAVS